MKDFCCEEMARFRSLFPENRNRTISQAYYEWKISRNPYGAGRIHLEKREDLVVGSATLTPKPLWVHGKAVPGAEIGDTFTHPDYRRQGIFTAGVKACLQAAGQRGLQVVYGTPNSQSLPGYEKNLDFFQMKSVRLRCFTKICRPGMLLLKCLIKICLFQNLSGQRKCLRQLRRQMKTVCPTVSSWPEGTMREWEVVRLEELDEPIDGLWGDPRFDFFVIRDQTYIRWRYLQNPDPYTVFAARKSQQYLGYLVVKYSKDGRTGFVCDFITRNDDPAVFRDLLIHAEKEMRRKKVFFIQIYCPSASPYAKVLRQSGYWEDLSEPDKPIILYSGTDTGRRLLEGHANSHFTLADCDNI